MSAPHSSFPKQLFLHRPEEGVFGDCHRTVIACLLGKAPADVPHFCEGDPDAREFHRRVEAYLGPQRLAEFTVAFDAPLDMLLDTMGRLNDGRFYILGGLSRTGVNHSVLCQGGAIVHDPSLTDAGIVGPMDDGFFRVTVLSLQPIASAPAASREEAGA